MMLKSGLNNVSECIYRHLLRTAANGYGHANSVSLVRGVRGSGNVAKQFVQDCEAMIRGVGEL